jgi:hypothetical protein
LRSDLIDLLFSVCYKFSDADDMEKVHLLLYYFALEAIEDGENLLAHKCLQKLAEDKGEEVLQQFNQMMMINGYPTEKYSIEDVLKLLTP